MYRSFDSNFEKEFFCPSYRESIRLERASGYFTLSSLILSIDGLVEFIQNGGEICLICNPDLSPNDIALIDAGTSLSSELITATLINEIDREHSFSTDDINALDIICNMIAEEKLKIKIAFKERGIYHEKFGIFYDKNGDRVYFNGSANETKAAMTDNFESFQVTTSWRDEICKTIIEEEVGYFHNIWNNRIQKLSVIDFPEVVKQNMFAHYKRSHTLQRAIDIYEDVGIVMEPNPTIDVKIKKKLYPYQEIAINEFVNNGFCHFYEMATGTGKTFTAIKTIQRLNEELGKTLFTMILVPQIDLQTQWEKSLNDEGFHNVFLLGGLGNNAIDEFNKATIEYYDENDIVCVAVYDTFFGKICDSIEDIDEIFLIVDEAHNISGNQLNKLPHNVPYKLGLSATIKRFNASETERILRYFTEDTSEPFYYGIEEAIENGFLSRYNYYPIYIHLDDDEFARYQRYTKSIATEMNKIEQDRDKQKLEAYRRDRSLIVKKASCKIDKLEEMVNGEYVFCNSVVYCGQGKDKDADEESRIIDTVTRILGDSGLRVSQFTSSTPDRKVILSDFESGYYDTLVAIKCFDEGVDVPKLDKIYIMASEGNLRQTVQRRGRVLRKCRETGKSIAHIYDMIALPPESTSFTEMGASSLIKNEFRRVYEYNRLAENTDINLINFENILDRFNLTEEDLNDDRTTD